MRVDKFLNVVNLLKRRAIAQDMCENSAVKVNGNLAKPSKEVKVGDVIELVYLEKTKRVEVLEIPVQKTIPKRDSAKFVREL